MAEYESLGGFLEHVSLVMDADAAAGEEAVSLMTLHSAKGLEFDVVVLPELDSRFSPRVPKFVTWSADPAQPPQRVCRYVNEALQSILPAEVQAAFRAGLGARWTFLSDAERRYVEELDLLEATDPFNKPYVPTVFTLFPDLRIPSVYNGYWYWGRPSPEELRADLREITRRIREDWEVSAA